MSKKIKLVYLYSNGKVHKGFVKNELIIEDDGEEIHVSRFINEQNTAITTVFAKDYVFPTGDTPFEACDKMMGHNARRAFEKYKEYYDFKEQMDIENMKVYDVMEKYLDE